MRYIGLSVFTTIQNGIDEGITAYTEMYKNLIEKSQLIQILHTADTIILENCETTCRNVNSKHLQHTTANYTVPLELNHLELQKWNTCKQYWSQTQNMQEKSPGMETAIKMTPCNTMRYLNQLKMTTQFL